MSLYDNVYGITYREAETQINVLEQALEQRDGKSFDKLEELEDWAKGHLLSKIVYSPSLKKFLYMSHRGELLLPSEFEAYYSSILRYKQISDGKVTTKPWIPDGFRFFKNAYIIGERSDGLHKPIYYRDYTVPSGYYSFERDAFNIAHPFKVFAKETGRDTSHIYIYLQHIAGECYMWLLAWLRAKLLYPCTKTQIMPIFVSKSQGSGKGQPLASRVLTPTGFRKLGDLCDGDLVVSPVDGKAYPISIHNRGTRHVNKVTMSNGAVTYCDDFHIWQARTVGEQSRHKDFHEMTITDIKSRPLKKHYDTKCGSYDAKQIFIPVTCAVEGTNDLAGAYAIGLFIGDGCYSNNSIYIDEADVLERAKQSLAELGYALSGNRGGDPNVYTVVMSGADEKFTDFLSSIGVEGHSYEKRLPTGFLQLTTSNRQELFEGLIDSDGCMTGSNNIDWSTTSEYLYEDMYDLASSLGLVVRYGKVKEAPAYQNGTGKSSYRYFMQYKDGLHLSDKHMSKLSRAQHKAFIAFENIEDAGDMECCCIYVDSPDHLYITDDWIVTHNTTFAEVICKGLFGEENVLVSDQYDSSARFNADYADSLIVCLEEKEETDKRNSAGALKSRTTATTIRKELKGVDPIYQDSYTDFIMTTNKDVPIKFDGQEDQRRFMIMEADPTFTRKTSDLADEVFTKLYGFDANMVKHGTPFTEDNDLIAQFKHELFTREDIAEVPLRNFPKTAAYNRCYSLPRTSESTEIEAIIKSIAPFIKASLEAGKIVDEVNDEKLTNIIQYKEALQYMPAYKDIKAHVALCRPLVFYEMGTMKPLPHANVERGLLDAASWLRDDYGLNLISDMSPLIGGFTGVSGRYKQAPTARFTLATDVDRPVYTPPVQVIKQPIQLKQERIGERFRVNNHFKPDANGCFETVNEMKPGTTDLKDKTKHVQYMDTFLLESDTATGLHKDIEQKRAAKLAEEQEFFGVPIEAEELYKERLDVALKESQRLFNEGIVARIVYSGAKSYHLLVRVADAPTTIEEYTFLHSWLCCHISDKLEFDQSTSDPARLTRSPIECKRSSKNYDLLIEGTQKLIAEDWSHVYSIDWRPLYQQWLNKPKEEYERKNCRPMIPTRQIYRDAVKDIVSGAFWCDSKWNGQRQECFFPAYRILRLMGYSHADLWPNVMLKGIDRYNKQADIPYWKSRESCALIESIDNDVEAYDECHSVS